MMFSHMDPYMTYMAQQIRLQQSPAGVMSVANDIALHISNNMSATSRAAITDNLAYMLRMKLPGEDSPGS